MRIPRFFTSDLLALGARLLLPKEAAHHAAKVLRLNPGAHVEMFNGDGHAYRAQILRLDKQEVTVLIEQRLEVSCESALQVRLVQGISSGERMDFTMQKCVELGVQTIQPVQTERSVVKLVGERKEKRVRHWQSIVESACEQCGRNYVPEVQSVVGLLEWLGSQDSGAENPSVLKLLLSPEAGIGLRELPKPEAPVILAVGPEGGFSETEQVALRQCGFVGARLGPRVLRTETAALAALSAMQALWGDF